MFPPLAGFEDYLAELRRTTQEANALLFAIVRDFAAQHTGGPKAGWTAANIQARTMPLLAALIARRDTMIAPNQDAMVLALERAIV